MLTVGFVPLLTDNQCHYPSPYTSILSVWIGRGAIVLPENISSFGVHLSCMWVGASQWETLVNGNARLEITQVMERCDWCVLCCPAMCTSEFDR
jgi:hypothetical protein